MPTSRKMNSCIKLFSISSTCNLLLIIMRADFNACGQSQIITASTIVSELFDVGEEKDDTLHVLPMCLSMEQFLPAIRMLA